MRRISLILTAFTLALLGPALGPTDGRAQNNDIFPKVYEKVDKFLALSDRYDRAEKDGWLPKPFTDTKSSVGAEMNKLLDGALESLLDDRLVKLKREINQLAADNARLRENIADWEMKRLAAPTDTKVYEIWKDNVGDLDGKIERARQSITANQDKMADHKMTIRALLAQSGVELSTAEVESLLQTVTGDEVIEAMAVLRNVHTIIARLKELMTRENENIHLAKKYYGLFLLATQAYDRQLELFLSRIDDQYRPRLARIRTDNSRLMDETRALARNAPKYNSNLEAQKITEKAAEKYDQVLKNQREKVEIRRREVGRILAHAENTYKTVNLAHSLAATMSDGLASYEALMNLPMIEAIPFENKDLELKFIELTQKMAE
jgi:hypothetical protein